MIEGPAGWFHVHSMAALADRRRMKHDSPQISGGRNELNHIIRGLFKVSIKARGTTVKHIE